MRRKRESSRDEDHGSIEKARQDVRSKNCEFIEKMLLTTQGVDRLAELVVDGKICPCPNAVARKSIEMVIEIDSALATIRKAIPQSFHDRRWRLQR